MHLAIIDSDSLPGCLPFEHQYFSIVRSPLHIPWLWTVWIDQGFFMQSLSCTLVILHSHWQKHHCMNVFVHRSQSFVLYAGREREKLVLSDRPLWICFLNALFVFLCPAFLPYNMVCNCVQLALCVDLRVEEAMIYLEYCICTHLYNSNHCVRAFPRKLASSAKHTTPFGQHSFYVVSRRGEIWAFESTYVLL